MKFNNTLLSMVEADLDAGLIPMLLGEPGIGKSSWVTALADHQHTKVFVMPCNQLADKADLTGARLVPTEDGDYAQQFYPHKIIVDAIKYARENAKENPILFLDELNRTTPDVTSELLSIPTLRSIGNTDLPNNLKVICAGNDKGNVTALDEASISRFVLYHVQPDVGTFLSLDQNLNPYVANVLKQHPEVIFCKSLKVGQSYEDDEDYSVDIEEILDEEDMSQITTPRTITGVSRWLNNLDNKKLLELLNDVYIANGEETNTLSEAIIGHVGNTAFAGYLLSEIATGITSGAADGTNAILTVKEPNWFQELKDCSSIDELEEKLENLSEKDLSYTLLYAMFDKNDNGTLIQSICNTLDSMSNDDMKTLVKLNFEDKLDTDNVSAFLNTNSNISNSIGRILEIV